MRYLAEHAEVVTLERLLTESPSDRVRCAITFDDGYESVFGEALPVLREFGFPATVYVTTDVISDTHNLPSDNFPGLYPSDRMLNWTQVKALSQAGISIGSHLKKHVDLTLLGPEQAGAQLCGSRQAIEQRVGSPCRDFSYPWGRYHRAALDWVKAAGYRTAVTGLHYPWTPGCDPLLIPRMDIRGEYTLDDVAAILRGDWDYLGRWQSIRRRVYE